MDKVLNELAKQYSQAAIKDPKLLARIKKLTLKINKQQATNYLKNKYGNNTN